MQITVPSLVRIKPNALRKIGKYCAQLKLTQTVLVLADGLPDQFIPIIEASCQEYHIHILKTEYCGTNNAAHLYQMSAQLPENTEGIVAVGGGRVIDACKFIGHIRHLPVVSCPTIISNDGFGSPFSSLIMNGVKRTQRTQLPSAIIVDTNVVGEAPSAFYFSGIGDLISNLTAVRDWKTAYHHANTYVDDFAVILSQTAAQNFMHISNKSVQDLDTVSALANGLILSGIAMEVADSSRPASGSEHLISHAYDIIADPNPHSHGHQVGVAAYVTSHFQESTHKSIRQCLIDSGFVDFMVSRPLSKVAFINAIHQAPLMKQNFYTPLADAGLRDHFIQFIEQDDLLRQMLH